MNKPKSVNFSFLILTLLFILSQTAFALSTTLTAQNTEMDSQLNRMENTNDIASVSSNDEQERAEMLALKKIKATTAEPTLTLLAATSADLTVAQAETTSAPAPTPTPAVKSVVRYVNANELNVREEPNAESNKVTALKRGDKVTYYETIGEWAKIITWTDKKGYILAKHLVNSEKEVDKIVVEKKITASTTTASRGTTEKTEASKPATEAQLSLAEKIVSYSKTLQGVPYKYGGYSTKGFDCSGFTKYVFAKYDIYVPRSSAEYWGFGTKVARSELRAGDIVLFDTDGGTADVSHVGIYVGGGNFIHASTTKKQVIVMNLASYRGKYMGARRVIK